VIPGCRVPRPSYARRGSYFTSGPAVLESNLSEQSRKLTRAAVRYALIAAGCVLCVLLVVPQLGVIWQLVHGNTVDFAGSQFSVPRRYLVQRHADGHISMWRADFGVPLWPAPFGFIGMSESHALRKVSSASDSGHIRSVLVAQEQSTGMSLSSEQTIRTGLGDAHCFHFRSENSGSTVTCVFEHGRIYARFHGSQKYAADFYDVVRSACRGQGGPNPHW